MTNPKDFEGTDQDFRDLAKQVQEDANERAKRGTGEESVE